MKQSIICNNFQGTDLTMNNSSLSFDPEYLFTLDSFTFQVEECSEFDGVLALPVQNNSILKDLKASGLIFHELFSIFIGQNSDSVLIFDEFDYSLYADPLDLTVKTIENSEFTLKSLIFGSLFKFTNTNAIISLRSDLILGPHDMVMAIFEHLLSKSDCEIVDFQYLFCASIEPHSFPDISFNFAGHTLTIPHDLLFIPYEDKYQFLINFHEFDYWILGKPLFYNYLITFDVENQVTSFLYSKYRPVDLEENEEEASEPFLNNDELYMLGYVVVGCIIIFFIARGIYLCSQFCGKSKENEENLEPLIEDTDAQDIAKFRAKNEAEKKRSQSN